VLVLALGCSATGEPLTRLAPQINGTYEADRMGLLPGDVLEVRFTEREEWNHETVVGDDGSASFLHLGSRRVGGLSLASLNDMLTEDYAETIRLFELTVFLTESGGRTVAVLGAVSEPGIYELSPGRSTRLEAFATAGGVEEARANLEDVYLVRWLPTEARQKTWHIDARTELWDEAEPVYLQPYDLVYVPLKGIVHVNIWVDQYIRQMIPFPYLIPPIN
jgi:polysaccharide export outer membrane protein